MPRSGAKNFGLAVKGKGTSASSLTSGLLMLELLAHQPEPARPRAGGLALDEDYARPVVASGKPGGCARWLLSCRRSPTCCAQKTNPT